MAKLDWALMCDVAYLDRFDRLSIIGITRHLVAPSLPVALPQLMIVGRLGELAQVDRVEVSVAVSTPSGAFLTADETSDELKIEMAREYVLVTFRDLPLTEEGVYSFRLQVGEASGIALEVPVVNAGRLQQPLVH